MRTAFLFSLLLAAAPSRATTPVVRPTVADFAAYCGRALDSAQGRERGLRTPTTGIASRPAELLAALLAHPVSPIEAWFEQRPFWYHALTTQLADPELTPDEIATVRKSLQQFRDQRFARVPDQVTDRLAAVTAQILRSEWEIAQARFRAWRKEETSANFAAAQTILALMLGQFLEVAWFSGSNWPSTLSEPVASLAQRAAGLWLTLHGIKAEEKTLSFGKAEYEAWLVKGSALPRLAMAVGTSHDDVTIAFSASACFTYDIRQTLHRERGTRSISRYLASPEDLLSLAQFGPTLYQGRFLLRSGMKMDDDAALPAQARIGIVPASANTPATADRILATARAVGAGQKTGAALYNPAARGIVYQHGIGMMYSRIAYLRAAAKIFEKQLKGNPPDELQLLALAHTSGSELELLSRSLRESAKAYPAIRTALARSVSALLLDEPDAEMRIQMRTTTTAAASLRGTAPSQQVALSPIYYTSGARNGVWAVASHVEARAVLLHTLVHIPTAPLGVEQPDIRVRLEPDGVLELVLDKYALHLPIQGQEMERVVAELLPLLTALDGAKQYRMLTAQTRQLAWELLSTLERRIYLAEAYAQKVAEHVKDVFPILRRYVATQSRADAEALRDALLALEAPNLDRLTLRNHARATAIAPAAYGRTIPVFPSRLERFGKLSEADQDKGRPALILDAVRMDAQLHGHVAVNVDPDHEGFDLRSSSLAGGSEQVLEVKSVRTDKEYVTLTPNELRAAILHGERWVLVVGHYDTDGQVRLEYFRGVFTGFADPGFYNGPLDLRRLRASSFGIASPWQSDAPR